jgi:hypothetical protein
MIPRSTDFFDRVLYLVRRYAIDRQLSEIACHQIPVRYCIHPIVLFVRSKESNAIVDALPSTYRLPANRQAIITLQAHHSLLSSDSLLQINSCEIDATTVTRRRT